MFGKGHLMILAGLGCIAAPGTAVLYEKYYVTDETAPAKMLTQQAQNDECIKESVQIAGVWVGCKATSGTQTEKAMPTKLRMNSQKSSGNSSTGSRFIRLE